MLVNDAEIFSNSIKKKAQGDSSALIEKITNQRSSLLDFKTKLTISNDDLLSFQWTKELSDIDSSSKIKFNLEMPKTLQCFYDKSLTC